MKVVIHDASVLIDLHRCGLLERWLSFGVEAHTSEARAAAALQVLLKNPRARLPKAECDVRLARWRAT